MQKLEIKQADHVQGSLPLGFSIKSGLGTSGFSNCNVLRGQETGSFSITFPTNLLAQPFVKVLSVLSMQEIAQVFNELPLHMN